MGEYANYRGDQIKIGTCESMYYLRADQADRVSPIRGNVDPIGDRYDIRFRFPFPDEDHIEPGAFEDFERSIPVTVDPAGLADVDHDRIQFVARQGYNVMLPCPEGPEAWKVTGGELDANVHRNGFAGNLRFGQVKHLRNGVTCLIAQCGGCGAKWRMETLADAAPVVEYLCERAEREQAEYDHYRARDAEDTELTELSGSALFHTEIARRIVAGYNVETIGVSLRDAVAVATR